MGALGRSQKNEEGRNWVPNSRRTLVEEKKKPRTIRVRGDQRIGKKPVEKTERETNFTGGGLLTERTRRPKKKRY